MAFMKPGLVGLLVLQLGITGVLWQFGEFSLPSPSKAVLPEALDNTTQVREARAELEIVNQALLVQPQSRDLWLKKFDLLVRLHRYQEAEEAVEVLEQLDPNNTMVRVLRGYLEQVRE